MIVYTDDCFIDCCW